MEISFNEVIGFIKANGSWLGPAIAALFTWLVSQKVYSTKRLKGDISVAIADIAFLLRVEAEHCQMHIDDGGESNKIRVRQVVEAQGYTFSGRFTPGRAKSLGGQKDSVLKRIFLPKDGDRQ